MLQGPYGSLGDREKPLIRLPFTDFAVGTVLLALTGLIACIVISLMIHFDESTYTHCQVPNYLPSISASISLVPERYIWRFCIGLHSAPRFLVAAVYFCFYRGRFAKSFPDLALSGLALITAIVENVGLLLLTYVSSTETYSVHKNGFITFIASSLLHMLITCRLWQVIKKFSLNPEEGSVVWAGDWDEHFLSLQVFKGACVVPLEGASLCLQCQLLSDRRLLFQTPQQVL
ncbi:post-GPI attachment to proteins factor 2 isoform X3 [Esox lucius]|uniref:post-GPI attachment to proteins factor 2 isoform X3 n=1 Tax=Esox lucius TaxID=8010 RepID=UPI0014769A2D|nr:post-GPI attachment to proteins factor 2 isoform X3 [Esox lucius]XP_019904022.2 post-GPI attachment to proteins factor 2 isoform X3 [Esox lucius]XP_034149167.1 post-GPI attachment to proteins factor 2 isoform X3 [Esox lucius]